ncbi:MAG TPA: translation initiation factor IF-2 associated domain-containing protein, partial [Thermohalobaculum sp.]|nr:translation initiation factor IF-2 associated domain-containing protein [Thermohalobaculum sp.]
MNDSDNDDNKIGGRGAGPRGPGGRGPGGRESVRQSFSHGRSKAVVVEKKRKRLLTAPEGAAKPGAAASVSTLSAKPQAPAAAKPAPRAEAPEAKAG